MSDWRFMVSEHDGTITRGKAYRLPSDWTSDAWSNYWDGDGMVGFTVDYHYGSRSMQPVATDEDNARAMAAYEAESNYDQTDALDKVAKRLCPEPMDKSAVGASDWNPRFIHVALDRGTDFYALSWHGDSDNAWRDEIEAVWNGDIWRIECEEYQPGFGFDGGDWVPADEYPEEFYGEDKATAEFERVFPLAEFPADLFIEASE